MVVVDLEAVRVERLAEEIADSMSATGSMRVAVVDVEDVDRWRRAARRAGRLLGWHIRTGASSEWVWATSEDWLPGPGADWRAARTFASLVAPLDRRER